MSGSQTIKGGCQCGAVRYEISGEPRVVGHCHCIDCQKANGAGHVTHALFQQDEIKIEGKTAEYASRADSGATVTRSFCSVCGGRLFGRSTSMPGMVTVQVGSMDDPNIVEPSMAVYARTRPHWDHMDATMPSFEAMPPMPV